MCVPWFSSCINFFLFFNLFNFLALWVLMVSVGLMIWLGVVICVLGSVH